VLDRAVAVVSDPEERQPVSIAMLRAGRNKTYRQ
jgi:hypothetical protein